MKRGKRAFTSMPGSVAFVIISILLAGAVAGASFYVQKEKPGTLVSIAGTVETRGGHLFFTITGERGSISWNELNFTALVNGKEVKVKTPHGSVEVGQHVTILSPVRNGSLEIKIVDEKDNKLIYDSFFTFHIPLAGKMMFEKNCTGSKMQPRHGKMCKGNERKVQRGSEVHKCTRNGAGRNSTRCACRREGRKGGCQGCQMHERKCRCGCGHVKTFKAWNPNDVQRRTFKGWNWRNERVRERQGWDYYFFLFFYFHTSWQVTYNHRSYGGSFSAWFLFYAIWKRNLLSPLTSLFTEEGSKDFKFRGSSFSR